MRWKCVYPVLLFFFLSLSCFFSEESRIPLPILQLRPNAINWIVGSQEMEDTLYRRFEVANPYPASYTRLEIPKLEIYDILIKNRENRGSEVFSLVRKCVDHPKLDDCVDFPRLPMELGGEEKMVFFIRLDNRLFGNHAATLVIRSNDSHRETRELFLSVTRDELRKDGSTQESGPQEHTERVQQPDASAPEEPAQE